LETNGGEIFFSGGLLTTLGANGYLGPRGRISMSGGAVSDTIFLAEADMRVTGGDLPRGVFGPGLRTTADSVLELVGQGFYYDGAPVAGLTLFQPIEFGGRGGVLSGALSDGSLFEMHLESNPTNFAPKTYHVVAGARLLLTLIPEPTSAVLLSLSFLASPRRAR
jgi:hypothetical protein